MSDTSYVPLLKKGDIVEVIATKKRGLIKKVHLGNGYLYEVCDGFYGYHELKKLKM